MFGNRDVIIYLANAGSGKTTALLQEVVTILDSVRPEEIAFTTFTRKGVETGRTRVLGMYNDLSPESLPYFKTLHSMCFKEAGLKVDQIITTKDLARFNDMLGFKLTFSSEFCAETIDDKMMARYSAVRSRANSGIYLSDSYDEERYTRLVAAYEKFKLENNKVDFYDCLTKYLEVGHPLPVEAFFLDEAQDVTPLQWEVVLKASENARIIRVAGDPSQCIFSYQGSDPTTLINLANTYKTVPLNITYRLPKKVCALADTVVDLMQVKIAQQHIAAKEEEGLIQVIDDKDLVARMVKKDFEQNGPLKNRWQLLFRTNHHIANMADSLESLLIPYNTAKGFVVSEKEYRKIARFYKYRKDGAGSESAREKFMQKYKIESFDQDFTETMLIPTKRRFVYDDYVQRFGMPTLAEYAKEESPFCLLTTPYKVKGGEADNVVVFLDATRMVTSNMMLDIDEELRVFYVSCTRAKKNLYIVLPTTRYNLMPIWDAVVEHGGNLW